MTSHREIAEAMFLLSKVGVIPSTTPATTWSLPGPLRFLMAARSEARRNPGGFSQVAKLLVDLERDAHCLFDDFASGDVIVALDVLAEGPGGRTAQQVLERCQFDLSDRISRIDVLYSEPADIVVAIR